MVLATATATVSEPVVTEAEPRVHMPQPQYVHMMVNGQVVAVPRRDVRYTGDGRILAVTES